MDASRESALLNNSVRSQVSSNAHRGPSPPVGVKSPPLPLRCRICSRDFKHSCALQMHLENSTAHQQTKPTTSISGSERAKKARTSVRCNICRQSFVNKIALGKHIGGSGRYEQFRCNICEREFINEDGYRMHIRTSKRHKVKLAASPSEEYTGKPFPEPEGVPCEDSGLSVIHSDSLQFCAQQTRAESGSQLVLAYHGPKLAICRTESDTTRSISNTSLAIIQYQSGYSRLEVGVNDDDDGFSVRCVGKQWSVIPQHEMNAALEVLSRHCHPPEHLIKNSYRLRTYTSDDLEGYRRCVNCSGKYQMSSASFFCLLGSPYRQLIIT